MTRDDIARMAREAGIEKAFDLRTEQFMVRFSDGSVERFAALVAAAEREACAQTCEEQGSGRRALEHYAALTYSGAAFECAVAIRARGDK